MVKDGFRQSMDHDTPYCAWKISILHNYDSYPAEKNSLSWFTGVLRYRSKAVDTAKNNTKVTDRTAIPDLGSSI